MSWDLNLPRNLRFAKFGWVMNSAMGPSQKHKRSLATTQTHTHFLLFGLILLLFGLFCSYLGSFQSYARDITNCHKIFTIVEVSAPYSSKLNNRLEPTTIKNKSVVKFCCARKISLNFCCCCCDFLFFILFHFLFNGFMIMFGEIRLFLLNQNSRDSQVKMFIKNLGLTKHINLKVIICNSFFYKL